MNVTVGLDQVPSPGSDEAVAAGCRCPRLDNARGQGAGVDDRGQAQFWINEDCTLHNPKEATDAPA